MCQGSMEEKGCFIYWGFRERQESLQAVYPPIILYKSLNKSLSLYYYPHFTMRKLSLRMAKWRYQFVWEGSKGEGRLKGHEGLGANLGSFIPLVSTHFVSLSACVPLELDNRKVPFSPNGMVSVADSRLPGRMSWRLLKRKVTFELYFRNAAE